MGWGFEQVLTHDTKVPLAPFCACWLMLSASADASKEDGIVHGATSLLRAQSLFRAVSRQPSALAGLVTALMAGSQYNSPQAQQSILECYLLFALRFIRPPQLAVAQVGSLVHAARSLHAQCMLAAQYSLPTAQYSPLSAQCRLPLHARAWCLMLTA